MIEYKVRIRQHEELHGTFTMATMQKHIRDRDIVKIYKHLEKLMKALRLHTPFVSNKSLGRRQNKERLLIVIHIRKLQAAPTHSSNCSLRIQSHNDCIETDVLSQNYFRRVWGAHVQGADRILHNINETTLPHVWKRNDVKETPIIGQVFTDSVVLV